MKKATISIQYDEEKLSALKFFAAQKGVDIDTEIPALVDKLYARYVPVKVRDYLHKKTSDEKKE